MSYIKLTDEGKALLDKMPQLLRYLADYLIDCLDSIIGGDCDEQAVASTVGTLQQNAKCRVNDADVVNYDEAGNILGFGTTNRSGLKKLLDKNGIKEVVINNQKCGFLRVEIMTLRDKLDEDIRKREIKRHNKIKRQNRERL